MIYTGHLRMAEPEDLYAQVARLHAAGIDQGFLSTLGEEFLALMYQAIDECPEAVLITEVKDGQVLGFVTGASGMRPIYRQMTRHRRLLIRAIAPALLSPRKVWRIMEILRHSLLAKRSKANSVDPELPLFELLSIAVASKARRQGIAQKLYKRLAGFIKAKGESNFYIVVGKKLKTAQQFYINAGAVPFTEISVHGKDRSIVYVQQI